MQHEFLNRFYSTQRTVSMTELTNTKQWKDEPVLDYINHWRSLGLKCKDHLSKTSAIKVHDIEMTIANHHGKSSSSYEFKKTNVKSRSAPSLPGINKGDHGHFP